MSLANWRDWFLFVTGVIVPAGVGLVYVSSDLTQSTQRVVVAFVILAVLFLFAAVVAFVQWQGFNSFKRRLGIRHIRSRDDAPPLHTIYRRIQHSYLWHGLSAVNELVGQTEVQSEIVSRSADGAWFMYVLTDPLDWIRMREQQRWEKGTLDNVERVINHIKNSQIAIQELQREGARVSLLSASRIPSFRIVEIDRNRIEVAHYHKGNCGYAGTYLELEKPRSTKKNFEDDHSGDGLLYHWFQRTAELERKNATLNLLYYEILKLFKAGTPKEQIVREITQDVRYEPLRRRFDEQFWSLSPEDIEKTIEYLSSRCT